MTTTDDCRCLFRKCSVRRALLPIETTVARFLFLAFSPEKRVPRCSNKRDVRQSCAAFEKPLTLKRAVQKADVIGAEMHVVKREPCRPQRSCEPRMSLVSRLRMFSRDIEVDRSERPSGLQETICMFDRCKPIRDHRQAIRTGHDVG